MNKVKIMIVEDEAIFAMVLKKILEGWGYMVCPIFATGQAAIENAGREKPDLLLMDVNIRGSMSGIEVATALKASFGIPSIFITGYMDRDMIENIRASGAHAWFSKPLDYNKLKLALDELLPLE